MSYGEEVAGEWRVEEAALGPARAGEPDVLVLGRGGSVVLECASFIRDGEGDDFVVFENAFSDTFLELAYVEVSSDGVHYVRFPNYSWTADPVGAFGTVDPTYIHGYAGKYRAGYGTPFDLAALKTAHAAVMDGYTGFSIDYWANLRTNYPSLDLERVRYIRLVDIPGDGSRYDSEGDPVFDPFPTVITAGFDLDAVGVLNQPDAALVPFDDWSSGHGLAVDPQADVDGDNWNQYMEYLLGSDPTQAHSVPEVQLDISRGPEDSIQYALTFWRNELAETMPVVEISTGGSGWEVFHGSMETLETRREEGISQAHQRIRGFDTGIRFWTRISAVPLK